MFSWYRKSHTCYAYLSDLQWFDYALEPSWKVDMTLGACRWFKRGWTLQELLAPASVIFFAKDWKRFGTKLGLLQAISDVTRIARSALLGRPLQHFNVAERMSWAAMRATTRVEDRAYCLLGLFGIHMPLLYGEGKRAFRRLQEQILESTEDYTIFAWESQDSIGWSGHDALLAVSPNLFAQRTGTPWRASDLSPLSTHAWHTLLPSGAPRDPPAITARGIKMHVPVIDMDSESGVQNAVIVLCAVNHSGEQFKYWLCLRVQSIPDARDTFGRKSLALMLLDRSQAEDVGVRVERLYALRKAWLDPSESSMTKPRAMLARVVLESLECLPAMDPISLAILLVEAEWCPRCQQFAATAQSPASSGSLSAASRQHQGDCAHDETLECGRVLMAFRDHWRVLGFTFDSELRKVKIAMENISGALSVGFRDLLLCCYVAWIFVQKRIMKRAAGHANAPDMSHYLIEWATEYSTVGCFAIKLCELSTQHWRGNADLLCHPAFLIYAVKCCRMFTESVEDVVVTEIAQASLASHLESLQLESPLSLPYAERQFVDIAGTFTLPRIAVQQFWSANGPLPDLQRPEDITEWTLSQVGAWSEYAPIQGLMVLADGLSKICFASIGTGTWPNADKYWLLARLFKHFQLVQIDLSDGSSDDLRADVGKVKLDWLPVVEVAIKYANMYWPRRVQVEDHS